MFGAKYLSEDHLSGFDKYKYNCIDTGYFSIYVMNPFWNKCVQYFPKWLAPNLITFVAFLLTVINFLLIGYFDWNFDAANDDTHPVPLWVWILAAVNVFSYYTLDGLDGKQARRTGTSGPLGELFDHGLDSYTTALIPIYMFSLFGSHDLPPIRMFFVLWNVFLNFYLTHVEKYNTGVMFLPWAYDFTLWGVSLTLLLTGFVGAWIWKIALPYGFTIANMFEILLIGSGMVSSHPIIIKNIYMSYKNGTGKMRPFMEAARPLFPFLWLFVISTIWVFFSINDIINKEPRIMFILFGTLFSNIACRLIVAQMSDTRCDGFNILMWPLVSVVMVSCFPFYQSWFNVDFEESLESLFLYILTAFITLAHLHYGISVVQEMCNHFRIKCFKVRKIPKLLKSNSITNNNHFKMK